MDSVEGVKWTISNTHHDNFQVSLFCVLFYVSRTAGEADAEAEASADAFYRVHGYGGFGGFGGQGYPSAGIYGSYGLTGWAGYGGHGGYPYPYLAGAGYAPQSQLPLYSGYPGYAGHAQHLSAPVHTPAPVHAPTHALTFSAPTPVSHIAAPDHGAAHISALAAHPGVPHSVVAVPDLAPLASHPAPAIAPSPQHAPVAPVHNA